MTQASDEMVWQNEDKLRELFELGYTQKQIAEEFGCSQATVSKWKNKFEIDINRQDKNGKKSQIPYFRTKDTGYEVVGSWNPERGCSDRAYIHRLIACLEEGFETTENMYVHHKNKIPWDNRAENIEVMTAKEHGQIHGGES